MLRYRQGDVVAFRLLYGRHRGGVYRYLLRLLYTEEAHHADDAAETLS